jgi:hypothetical protein
MNSFVSNYKLITGVTMNYLIAKKALRDTMSAEDYTETIDFSELLEFPPIEVLDKNAYLDMQRLRFTSHNLISTDLHLDMILMGYISA